MRIVGGLDVHRAQITFDYVDLRTGEETRGQIKPATREEVRAFLVTLGKKKAAFALEGTTGWRFIVEELRDLNTAAGRTELDRAMLPDAAREVLAIGMRMLDCLSVEIDAIDRKLVPLARRLPGCQVIARQWGIGPVLSVTILAELGDTRRFSSSRQAVRFAGLDVTVEESDGNRSRGHLSRQGSPTLRWALYEAATSAYRLASPDHEYYLAAKERLGVKRARLSVARRILRRVHHELAAAGEEAFAKAA